MNRHQRRAAKARKTKSPRDMSNREMVDRAGEMFEDGLGELRVDICHLTRNDAARSALADFLREFCELGMRCASCNQVLDTDSVGALAMISPGGDYVMDFDERGVATKPVISQALCQSCCWKPELERLVAENFVRELGYREYGAPS